MAYAAATCLKNTTERLLNHPNYTTLVPPSRETIQVAHTEAESLMLLLRELDETSKCRSRKRVNALDGQIRETVTKFEDVLESRLADQLLLRPDHEYRVADHWILQSDQEGNGNGVQFSINLLDLKQHIQFFTRRLKKLRRLYRKALRKMPEDDDDDDDDDGGVSLSATDFGGEKTKMVGLSDQFRKVKDWALNNPGSELMFLVGMGGIGKTALAKKMYDDSDVSSHFQCRAWVKVGRKRQLNDVLRAIIAQVHPDSDQILAGRDKDMAKYLKESLKGRRFLIVGDDVWDSRLWQDLVGLIPKGDAKSRVLLTTRSHEVAVSFFTMNMRFLNREESWDLLRKKVFAREYWCSPQLEKAGKKIADKCGGLPLTILAIAKLLFGAEMTPEYWNEVAENRNRVFTDALDEVSKVLYPSYDYLPQHLKMCFITTGVFPQDYVIRRPKIISMWGVEEFLETNKEKFATNCLVKLAENSLVMVHQKSSSLGRVIKTCGVHASLWHLCKREARQNKLFHVLSSRKHGLSEDVKGQRRLCIHNNVLFAIKDVHSSLEKDCASSARSLGCFGPYHPYQVRITFGLRLLRLLDVITIRFYEFPMEVQDLVLLRYFALTYSGMLPDSISELRDLQFLIVRPHLRMIKSGRAPTYLPMEIWDMKELKHLRVTGSDLPHPCSDTFLPNLLTLLDVSEHMCTRKVFNRISNLNKLGIRIELRPDVDEPLSFFAHISCLKKLETLKCVIVNPEYKFNIAASPTLLSKFPSGLRKLSLSGLGCPWEEMSKIASLPNLQVLKLRNYAFQGAKWEMNENKFQKLMVLVIEDTDLVQWKVGYQSFGDSFTCLRLKHCYKLEKINWQPFILPADLQVLDCNPLALTCLKRKTLRIPSQTFDAHSSWDDGEINQKVSDYLRYF